MALSEPHHQSGNVSAVSTFQHMPLHVKIRSSKYLSDLTIGLDVGTEGSDM
jgi:hypothetical protein